MPEAVFGGGLCDFFRHAERFLFSPLTAHFRGGPRWAGGWEGASDATICAHLGHSDAAFWEANAVECARLIDRRAASHVVLLRAAAYVYVVSTLAARYLVVRPAARELARALRAVGHEAGGPRERRRLQG